jgi:hypothetical protein
MLRRYRVVAWSYCRTWTFLAVLGLLLLYVAIVIVPVALMPRRAPLTLSSTISVFLTFAFCPLGFSSVLVANLVKEHLAQPQAALVPGFRSPHIVVALIWLGLVALLLAFAVSLLGVSMLGAIAAFLAVIALCLWLTQVVPPLAYGLWIFALLFGSRVVSSSDDLVKLILAGPVLPNVILSCLSTSAIADWARRLMHLNEERFDYHIRWPWAEGSQKTHDQRAARIELVELPDRLNRLRGYVGEAAWDRVQLWRLGNGPVPPWFDPLFGAALFGLGYATFLAAGVEIAAAGEHIAPRILLALAPVFLPYARMRDALGRGLAREVLRPCSKAEMFRELGLGVGLDVLYSWVGATLACLAITFVWLTDFMTISAAAGILLFSLGAACFFFGMGAWLAHFRAQSIAGLIGILMLALAAGGLGVLFSPPVLLPIWIALSLVMIGAGAAFARLAHRAWCETELG